MAEVLGVVSGGAGLASLAFQLGENALRIRRFYKRYQNAPTALEDAADELEGFQALLSEVEKECELCQEVDFTILNRCITMCRRSIKTTGDTVDKLESLMARSQRWGRLRTAAEEKELCRLSDDLQKATNLLTLAYLMYSESQRKQEAERQRAESERQRALLEQVASSQQVFFSQEHSVKVSQTIRPGQADRSEVQLVSKPLGSAGSRTNRNGRRQFYRMRLRFQPWFAATSWEFSMRQTYAGWSLNLHTTYVIPFDSHIFRYAEQGNVSALRKLFASGRGIPNVCCDVRRYDLLVYAFMSGDLETFEYLWSILPRTGQEYNLLLNCQYWRKQTRRDVTRLLLNDADVEDAGIYWYDTLDKECLEMIPNLAPEILQMQYWGNRLDFAMTLEYVIDGIFNATGFLWAAGASVIDGEFARAIDSAGNTALHFATRAFRRLRNKNDAHLIEFLRALHLAGADFHHQNVQGKTPLHYILAVALENVCPWPLQQWATILHELGIDLLEYGFRERTILKAAPFEAPWTFLSWEIFDIAIGERPGDFDIGLRKVIKVQTWKASKLPGGWIPDTRLPSTICWEPDANFDTSDYSWELLHTNELPATRSYLLSDFSSNSKRIRSHWTESQDDCGYAALAMNRRRIDDSFPSALKRRRSHSLPALHRLQDHEAFDERRDTWPAAYDIEVPFWRRSLHSCPFRRGEVIHCSEYMYKFGPRCCLAASDSLDELWEVIHGYVQSERRWYVREIEAARFFEELDNV